MVRIERYASLICRDHAIIKRLNLKYISQTQPVYSETPSKLSSLAAIALFMMGAFMVSFNQIGEHAMELMVLLGSAAFIIYEKKLHRDIIIKLFLTAILIQLASWAYSHVFHPEVAERSPKLNRMGPWFLMVPIAVALQGSTKRSLILLAAVLIGAIIAPWISGNGWREIVSGMNGRRIDFNLNNAQHASVLFASCLIGLFCFRKRIVRATQIPKAISNILVTIAIIFCIGMVVFTQTRASWLGLFAALIIMAFHLIAHWNNGNIHHRKLIKRLSLGALTIFLIISAVLALSTNHLNRLVNSQTSTTISTILKGDMHTLYQTPSQKVDLSVLVRVTGWIEGAKLIAENPLLGWGGKGRKLVKLTPNGAPNNIANKIPHLHSTYFDTAVCYGLLGLSLYIVLIVVMLKVARTAWENSNLPSDFLYFFYAFITYWIVVNFFESYMFRNSGRLLFGVACGIVLTHYWFKPPAKARHIEP